MTWPLSGYESVRELGTGASGTVMLARHVATGRLVAVKYLSARLASNPAFIADFRAEARLLADLDDVNTARLYEYIQSGDQAATVLELVDGVTLHRLLADRGAVTPEAALVVLKGSLLGLAAAHDHGVVHRDYKPGNVLVTGAGATKLIDFGIAVRAGQEMPSAGTPDYMAPEQWAGSPATPATDVYAATAVFVECLTGRRPYASDSLAALRLQHLNAPAPVDDLPESVRPLVSSGMAKDPTRRPATARDLLGRLEICARDGYGPDWEQRGRRELGRLALLLAAFFPLTPVAATGLSALALTVLGRGRWIAAAGAAVVAVGGAAVAATGGAQSRAAIERPTLATATAGALSGASPTGGSPSRPGPTSRRPPGVPRSTDPSRSAGSPDVTRPAGAPRPTPALDATRTHARTERADTFSAARLDPGAFQPGALDPGAAGRGDDQEDRPHRRRQLWPRHRDDLRRRATADHRAPRVQRRDVRADQ